MRKVFYIAIVILGASIFASCQKEYVPTFSGKTGNIMVQLGLGERTKAQFADAEGITWTAGDQIHIIKKNDAGTGLDGVSSPEITGLSGDNNTATVSETFISGKEYLFRYGDWGQDEFQFGNNLTQVEAGTMPSSFLHLHSGTTTVAITDKEVEEGSASKRMHIVGSILRFLPYTTSRNTESVQSITFSTSTNILGTVGYQYHADGSFKSWTESFIYGGVKSGTVTLTNAFALTSATDKEHSAGIYLPVPAQAGTISGYTITVATDVATYTFETDTDLTINENVVKNVYLNLDKAERLVLGHFRMALSKVTNNGDLTLGTASTSKNATGVYVGLDGLGGKMADVSWTAQVYSSLIGENTYLTTYGVGGGTTLNNDGTASANVSRTGVNGDFDFTFNISANVAPIERTWTIVITTDHAMVDNSPYSFVITQAAGDGYPFTLTKADVEGDNEYAQHYDFVNDISTDEMPSSGQSMWIDMTSVDGVVYTCTASYVQGGDPVYPDGMTWERTVGAGDDIAGVAFPSNALPTERIWTLTCTTTNAFVAESNRTTHIRFKQKGTGE